MSKLFCFDFDQTLTRVHFHNLMVYGLASGLPREEVLAQALRRLRDNGVKHSAEISILWGALLNAGHCLAITSFSSFPEPVSYTHLTLPTICSV